jgi:hypothetical protein
VYPLVYGDDVDGIVDDGIPENDTPDASYRVVSIGSVLRVIFMFMLTESRREKGTDRSADGTRELREKRDIPVDTDFDGHIQRG